MFDKLKFWKKEDEFDFDNLADKELQTSQKPDPLGLEKSPFFVNEKTVFSNSG